MRKIFFLPVLISFFIVACSQTLKETDIPVIVASTFKNLYPLATNNHWTKEKKGYEASFVNDNKDCSVVFDATGVVLETEVEIAETALPEAAQKYLAAKYPGVKIKETAIITDAKGTKTYEAEVKGNDLIFDAEGNFINKNND
ncbi:MAG TPA: PepSY-like domain-containing protein [Chitinophagaceae bacterium]